MVPLAEVGDGVFSARLMGAGVGIVPVGGEARAPVSGVLTTVFPTGHAYGIRTADGVEVLVHIGLDTVELAGRGFATAVIQGCSVAAGDLLGTFDIPQLRAAGVDLTTLVVVPNAAQLAAVMPVAGGEVRTGDVVARVDPTAS